MSFLETNIQQNKKPMPIKQSMFLKFYPERCTGCGACELACVLYHEGFSNLAFSRIHLIYDPFAGDHKAEVCIQCYSPGCYYACPVNAVQIDSGTGARYIDYEKCIGCGACERACPLMPEKLIIRYKLVDGKRKYFKCDLCRGRPGGPACVEACPASALELAKVR
ncbi:MAG: 4Fe-4S dicluster domain-containing protein [Candidatus Bathyarchaeia archaeon]